MIQLLGQQPGSTFNNIYMCYVFNFKLSMQNFKIISQFTKTVVYLAKMDIYLEEQFKTFFQNSTSYFKPRQRIWNISFIQVYWWGKHRSERKVPLPYIVAGTVGIWGQNIIVMCYPLHGRIFSSIPVLFPLDINSSPYLGQSNTSPDLGICSLGSKLAPG